MEVTSKLGLIEFQSYLTRNPFRIGVNFLDHFFIHPFWVFVFLKLYKDILLLKVSCIKSMNFLSFYIFFCKFTLKNISGKSFMKN